MLAVAVDANGRIPDARLDRFPVHTLVELPGDFLVALPTGFRHFPVIDLGSRIGGGIDVMSAMATGTGSRILAERDRAPVNALLIGIHRMRHRNFVPRQEPRIAMAFCTSIRQVLASNGRVGFAGGFDGVDEAVAGLAFGRVWVAVFGGLTVNAGCEVLHFLRMTLRALSGNQLFRGDELMHAAMTRSARGFAEDGVSAGGERLGLVGMAGAALNFGDFCGMRKIFDGSVAVLAAENRVGAGSMFGRVNVNALASAGLHSRLAMARQTLLVHGGRNCRCRQSRSQNQGQVNQSIPSRTHFYPSPPTDNPLVESRASPPGWTGETPVPPPYDSSRSDRSSGTRTTPHRRSTAQC